MYCLCHLYAELAETSHEEEANEATMQNDEKCYSSAYLTEKNSSSVLFYSVSASVRRMCLRAMAVLVKMHCLILALAAVAT